MSFKIGNKNIGKDYPCFIIAEIGINHNGNITLAELLIDNAKRCGADAVKFQAHFPEHEMLKDTPTANYVGQALFDLLKKIQLSEKQLQHLKEYTEQQGLIFLATPFCRYAVDVLETMNIQAYKVGSGEITNYPLLEHIAKTNKPMIISTGMSKITEINDTICFLKSLKASFSLLHCVSTYPTKYEDLNLSFLEELQELDETIPIGLSDHTEGIYTALASIPLGACIIEKHFTLDKYECSGPDQQSSLEPSELRELVKGVRAIESALEHKALPQEIEQIRQMATHSIVSKVFIPKDTIIAEQHIDIKRPGTGISAKFYREILGNHKAKNNIKKDMVIQWKDLEALD